MDKSLEGEQRSNVWEVQLVSGRLCAPFVPCTCSGRTWCGVMKLVLKSQLGQAASAFDNFDDDVMKVLGSSANAP
jgi:hypothetical protein